MKDNVIKTVEDLKKNMQILETKMATDNVDPEKDLVLTMTWVDFFMPPNSDPDMRQYFLNESLPKIIRSVLKRKYASTPSHHETAKNFLCSAAKLLASSIHLGIPGVYNALSDLFDASQPFYLKYGFPKATQVVVETAASKAASAHKKFLTDLTLDDVVDYRLNSGEWDSGIVTGFNNQRGEVEVMNIATEKHEWLSLEKDAERISGFCTKTQNDVSASSQSTQVQDSVVNVASTDAVEMLVDAAWLANLRVGSLMDCRDKANVWHQACVMETRTFPIAPTQGAHLSPDEDPPVPPVPASLPEANLDNSLLSADVSLGDIDLGLIGDDEDSPARKYARNGDLDVAAIVSDSPIKIGTNVADESVYSEVVSDCSFLNTTLGDLDVSMNVNLQDKSYLVADITPTVPSVRVELRISYLGCPEKNDEWVGLESGRICVLNSRSGGRRGDLSIREEVQFVATSQSTDIVTDDDHQSIAVNHYGILYSPYYVEIVNNFGAAGGFDIALKCLSAHVPPDNIVSVPICLEIAGAIGSTAHVLSKRFIEKYAVEFIRVVSDILRSITFVEVRNISIEKIEDAICALEGFSIVLFGRNSAAGGFEYLWLDVAVFLLNCPYLNRRLGGLKFLSDLIRRVSAAVEFENGLKTTYTVSSTGEESVSYRVIPITYAINMKFICRKLTDNRVLFSLFQGEGSHFSLIARSADVLRALAKEGKLGQELLTAIWEAGYVAKKLEAYQLLADISSVLEPSFLLPFLRQNLMRAEPSNVTPEVVDFVAAIGIRCRSALMETSTSSLPQPTIGISDEDFAVQFPSIYITLQLHGLTIQLLWNWASDGSGFSKHIATACLNKIETILQLGTPLQAAMLKSDFPWSMQFRRADDVIDLAISALSSGQSINAAVFVLQACLNAMPNKDEADSKLQLSSENQFAKSKSDLALYIESEFSVMKLVTSAVVTLKKNLIAEVPKLVSEGEYLESFTNYFAAPARLRIGNCPSLEYKDHAAVNGAVLGTSRSTYKETLECLLNFLHVFVRCSESLYLSQICVGEIWSHIVMNALTEVEVDCAMNFFSRIVIRLLPKTQTVKFIADAAVSTTEAGSQNGSSNTLNPRRSSVGKEETVQLIFNSLLCGSPTFIQSRFFNSSALDCIEKYFRWCNSQAGFLVERNDTTTPFVIIGKPLELKGLHIFSDILLNCCIDTVALNAVRFLTTLTRRLSPALVMSGELTLLRSMLVDLCLSNLNDLDAEDTTKLKRLLMLLDGVLEESNQGGNDRLRPHGLGGRGEPLSLSVSFTAKHMKQYNCQIVLQSTDTVGTLIDLIGLKCKRSPGTLKVFRGGQECNQETLTKTLAQIKAVNGETVMVAERPAPKPSGDATVVDVLNENADKDGSRVASKELRQSSVSFDSLPAVVLSHSKQHFNLFFELLDNSVGSLCDDIWDLINRLPTAPFVLVDWLKLECHCISDILFPEILDETEVLSDPFAQDEVEADVMPNITLSGPKLSISYLLYSLQVIDILMQPARSQADVEKLKSDKSGLWSRDLDPDLIDTWPDRFVMKSGIHALVQAFSWVAEMLEEFSCTYVLADRTQPNAPNQIMSPSLPGITAKLLLQTLELITTIIQSLSARAMHKRNPGSVVDILALVAKKEGRKKDNKKPPSVGSAIVKRTKADHMAKKEFSLVSKEWGWRLENCEVFVDYYFREVDFPSLQRFVSLLLTLVRPYSCHTIFSVEAVWASSEKLKISVLRERLMNIVRKLFVIWTVALNGDPTIIREVMCAAGTNAEQELIWDDSPAKLVSTQLFNADFNRIYIDVLLEELMLGQISTYNPNILVGSVDFATDVANFVVDALQVLIYCVEHPKGITQSDSANAEFSLARHFKREIFCSLLSLRPPVFLETYGRLSVLSTNSINSALGPMFNLASSIFVAVEPSVPLAVEDATDSCEKITAGSTAENDSVAAEHGTASLPINCFDTDDEDQGGQTDQTLTLTLDVSPLGPSISSKREFLETDFRARVSLRILEELLDASALLLENYSANLPSPRLFHIGGTLELLASLIADSPTILAELYAKNVIPFLLQKCLGLLPIDEAPTNVSKPVPMLCEDDTSRWSDEIAVGIFKAVSVIHNNMPPSPTFSYKPEKESLSVTGYVGIRNMGCTCYMNSLLQVLYTIPEIRNGILTATLRADQSDEDRRNDPLVQLQKLFMLLKYSQAKSISPDDWVYSYKDETGLNPINVMQQQDAQEFLQVLTDRLEQSLAAAEQHLTTENSASQSRQRDLLKHAFGGKLCNLMLNNSFISSPTYQTESSSTTANSPVPPFSKHVREHEEPFVCISVDVKGSKGLEDSLSRFVEGERFSDFIWEETSPRVTITKHQCVSELSDTLIFHLKRFELNFDTFRREKVNDSFPFPKKLNMKPYTKEHLLASLYGQHVNSDVRPDDYYEYELRGVVVHSGTADAGHYFSYIKVPDAGISDEEAVTSQREWVEFNDSEVKEFSEARLDSECFGGTTVMHEFVGKSQSAVSYSVENPQSAYMLVYHRTIPRNTRHLSNSDRKPELTGIKEKIFDQIVVENKKLRLAQRIFSLSHLQFYVNCFQCIIDSDKLISGSQRRNLNANIVAEAILFATTVLNKSSYPELMKLMNAKVCAVLDNSKQLVARVPKSESFPLLQHCPQFIEPMSPSELESFVAASLLRNSVTSDPVVGSPVDEDVAAAIALSQLSPSEVVIGSHNSSIEVGTFSVATLVLRKFASVQWMEQVVMRNLIHAPEKDVRMRFAMILLRLISLAREEDGDSPYYFATPEVLENGTMLTIMDSVIAATAKSSNAVSEIVDGVSIEDDDLALAIKLSQSESIAQDSNGTQAATLPTVNPALSASATPLEEVIPWTELSLRIIIELTMEWRLILIAEHWRKADAYTWLLKELALLGGPVCLVLVEREVVWALIDIYLGDQTPEFTELYPKGSRKRAPSSYVDVGPPLKNGSAPSSAKSLPDWSYLLETVSLLVTASKSFSMVRNFGIPPTLRFRQMRRLPHMRANSANLTVTKLFLLTILKQARYTPLVLPMLLHQSFECLGYIQNCAACFSDAFNFSPYENYAHLFFLYEKLINQRDEQTNVRVRLFITDRDALLSVMQRFESDLSKNSSLANTFCVLVRSFLALIQNAPALRQEISYTRSYNQWAPWMLKAIYQFKERCAVEVKSTAVTPASNSAADSIGPQLPASEVAVATGNQSAPESNGKDAGVTAQSDSTAGASTTSSKPPPKGPYLVIYGESEAEREITWAQRAETTFALLQELLASFGANADTLIPEDAFLQPVIAEEDPELVAAKQASVMDTGTGTGVEMFDGMTDDEIAAYLQMQDDQLGID